MWNPSASERDSSQSKPILALCKYEWPKTVLMPTGKGMQRGYKVWHVCSISPKCHVRAQSLTGHWYHGEMHVWLLQEELRIYPENYVLKVYVLGLVTSKEEKTVCCLSNWLFINEVLYVSQSSLWTEYKSSIVRPSKKKTTGRENGGGCEEAYLEVHSKGFLHYIWGTKETLPSVT